MLSKAQLESASDVAAEALFDAIVDRKLPPGSPLRLKDLSEQLGMSMMPVREAIRRLAALDLVEIEPRKGARVRELTMVDLEDTYFTRMHLEGLAVREAARRFTPEAAARAATALAERESAAASGDRVAVRDAHERFHFAIYEAAGRPWLLRSILPVWRNSERYRVEALYREDLAHERDHEHAEILAAVRRGDGNAAARWLTAHLASSVQLAATSLAAERGEPAPELGLPSVDELLAGAGLHGGGPVGPVVSTPA